MLDRIEAVEPDFAGMHDECVASGGGDRIDDGIQDLVVLAVIKPDPDCDRHGQSDGCPGSNRAVGRQHRLIYQVGAKALGACPIRRATSVEIDFVEAEIGPNFCRRGNGAGIVAAQLQCDRMFGGIEGSALNLAAIGDQSGRLDHFRVEPRAWRQEARQISEVPITAPRHGRDAQSMDA